MSKIRIPTLVCNCCKIEKSIDAFYKKTDNEVYHAKCRICTNAKKSKRRKEDPEYKTYLSRKTQETRIRKSYGIQPAEYDKCMATSCVCQICGEDKNLVYDHDHNTMLFRGVLCRNCNIGIGLLGDSQEALKKAHKYLKEHYE